MIFENANELIFRLVSPHSLKKYDIIENGRVNKKIPEAGGIYFLYGINDILLYLSRTTNIRRGVLSHTNEIRHRAFIKIPPSEIMQVAFTQISKSIIREIAERIYLLHYKPKYNATHFSASASVLSHTLHHESKQGQSHGGAF